jgi:hypothetical protein
MPRFQGVNYANLNSKQKEIFNFQKVAGLLAEYGYAALRLTDDWNGADFLAVHIDGKTVLRVQLKSRLTFLKRYVGQNLWICYRQGGIVYLYPHDHFLKVVLASTNIENTQSWSGDDGGYTFPAPPKAVQKLLNKYCLGAESAPAN